MDEHELDPEKPDARPVDELRTRTFEPIERGAEIVGLDRDVVHPGTAPRKEATDRGVFTRRRQKLETTVADEKRRGLDSLVDERLAMLETSGEEALVRRDRLVEIRDGDADVMDALHGRDAIRAGQSRMGSARTVPIVSDDRDSGATSTSRASSSPRSSVSFSRSAWATRSSAGRCFIRSRFASS